MEPWVTITIADDENLTSVGRWLKTKMFHGVSRLESLLTMTDKRLKRASRWCRSIYTLRRWFVPLSEHTATVSRLNTLIRSAEEDAASMHIRASDMESEMAKMHLGSGLAGALSNPMGVGASTAKLDQCHEVVVFSFPAWRREVSSFELVQMGNAHVGDIIANRLMKDLKEWWAPVVQDTVQRHFIGDPAAADPKRVIERDRAEHGHARNTMKTQIGRQMMTPGADMWPPFSPDDFVSPDATFTYHADRYRK